MVPKVGILYHKSGDGFGTIPFDMVPKDEQLQEWFSVCFDVSTVDMVPKDILYLIILVPVHLTWFQRTSKLVRFDTSPIDTV